VAPQSTTTLATNNKKSSRPGRGSLKTRERRQEWLPAFETEGGVSMHCPTPSSMVLADRASPPAKFLRREGNRVMPLRVMRSGRRRWGSFAPSIAAGDEMAGNGGDRGITNNTTGLGVVAGGIVLRTSDACAFGAAALPGHHHSGEASFGGGALGGTGALLEGGTGRVAPGGRTARRE